MLPDWVLSLPPWLVFGLLAGAAASAVVAGVFVVGGRLFPDGPGHQGPRVDGAGRRHVEIRDYLRRIDESFFEEYPVHGETVSFYLPERDVAITFDAQAYFRLERAGTYTVLCEHEMPAHGLGRRLPFEVPRLEPELAARDDPVAAAYDYLGVTRAAGPAEVKRAYRDLAKERHPDHGGTRDEFKRLQEAYATAREDAEGAAA